MDTDVLICGAGPTGLTLAIELARRNVSFRLIDKAPAPFAGSRGKGLQPRTLEVFEQMGIADRVAAAGGAYPPARSYAADGSFSETVFDERRPASPAEPYGQIVMLPQFLTEGLLRDRLAELGGTVEFGAEIVRFQQDRGEVRAKIRTAGGERTIKTRYLIGADGGRSFVRQALKVGFPGEDLGFRAVVADLHVEGLDRDAWHRWGSGPGSHLALCPLAGTGLFQLQAAVPAEVEPDISLPALRALVRQRTARDDIVVRDVTWASAFRGSARLADRYVDGRVILAGDAAHVHPPTGGQGLNTSVQDAWNLGWKLAAVLQANTDLKTPDLLDTYEIERREVAAGMLGLSVKLLEAARREADMRRDRTTQQLDIGYPDSPLSLDGRGRGLTAGMRAPDAPCRGAGGQPLRLFRLFGPHWTLLACESRAKIEPRKGLHIHDIGKDLIDEGGHIAAAYGFEPGDLALIRPDGYVGALTTDPAELEAYLRRAGLS